VHNHRLRLPPLWECGGLPPLCLATSLLVVPFPSPLPFAFAFAFAVAFASNPVTAGLAASPRDPAAFAFAFAFAVALRVAQRRTSTPRESRRRSRTPSPRQPLRPSHRRLPLLCTKETFYKPLASLHPARRAIIPHHVQTCSTYARSS
jgi:hypothetical protein